MTKETNFYWLIFYVIYLCTFFIVDYTNTTECTCQMVLNKNLIIIAFQLSPFRNLISYGVGEVLVQQWTFSNHWMFYC